MDSLRASFNSLRLFVVDFLELWIHSILDSCEPAFFWIAQSPAAYFLPLRFGIFVLFRLIVILAILYAIREAVIGVTSFESKD